MGRRDGGKIGYKNKLILTNLFPSMYETRYLKVLIILVLLYPRCQWKNSVMLGGKWILLVETEW